MAGGGLPRHRGGRARRCGARAGREGLGGLVLPPGVQDEVLRELEAWAAAEIGDLDAEQETEETYVLEGARLPSGG